MNSIPLKKLGLAIGAGVVIVGAICLLTGCGGGGSSGANPTPTPTPTPRTITEEANQFIAQRHPDSAKKRAALTQYADVIIAALADANDKTKSLKHGDEAMRATECLTYILGSADAMIADKNALRAAIVTNDRIDRYNTYNDQLGGAVFPLKSDFASSCTFDPSSFPN